MHFDRSFSFHSYFFVFKSYKSSLSDCKRIVSLGGLQHSYFGYIFCDTLYNSVSKYASEKLQ